MKVVNANEMREIDRITIHERGTPAIRLMEEAGRAVAEMIVNDFSPWNVAIVTGKGNNAGDGFVAAIHLSRRNVKVFLYMLAPPDELSGDARFYFDKLPPDVRKTQVDESNISLFAEEIKNDDCIVDAILGTGVKGTVHGLFAKAIEAINSSYRTVVAIDIPSGLFSDETHFDGISIKATMTVTMGLPKIGMVIPPGVQYCGKLHVAPLSFPLDLLYDKKLKHNLIIADMVRSFMPERQQNSNKKTFGYLLIIAGSTGMTGAAVLAARAASRSGSGLTYLAIPRRCLSAVDAHLIDPVKIPVADTDDGCFSSASFDDIKALLSRIDAVAVGPGLSRNPETREFIHRLLAETANKPILLDADALNLISDATYLLKNRRIPPVLTPHPGEMARLLGLDATPDTVQKNRMYVARSFAREHAVVLVLKGFRTIIAAPDGEIWINTTGNSGLAKGGSGDVLTGLIGGYLAQHIEPPKAAIIGVYLHGLTADVTARRLTERGMTPVDLIQYIPEMYQELARINDDPRIRLPMSEML